MNDGHGNGGNSSVNGKPYDYSADNGFACAAAGRGITEALQEHLNVIARKVSSRKLISVKLKLRLYQTKRRNNALT